MLANSQKNYNPLVVLRSHLFAYLIKCFPKLYVMTQQHQGHGEDRLQGIGLDASPVLQGGDRAWVLPTQQLPGTNQTTPKFFAQIVPSVQKLFMIFRSTDGQTHNKSPHYHIWVWVTIFCPVFSTFSLTTFTCLLCFVQDKVLKKLLSWPQTQDQSVLIEKK